jgi:hypothetical protein
MKVKLYDMTDHALNWCVATALGEKKYRLEPIEFLNRRGEGQFRFTTDWGQGGWMLDDELDREGYEFGVDSTGLGPAQKFEAWVGGNGYLGPTILVAAMRGFVGETLGTEVDVPEELLHA